MNNTPLLKVTRLCAGYGAARVLHELDLEVTQGETLVVIGRNGVGKTTLLETLVGLTTYHSGEVVYQGRNIETMPPHRRNRNGIAWVPQSREVFPSLTVEEHLDVVYRVGEWSKERVWKLFPRLKERRGNYGNQLSGGEQQMLAMGRALMTNPALLLLDEPVEGLAPLIVVEMMHAIEQMRSESQMSIILVEQKYELALKHSMRCLVLDHGSEVYNGSSAELLGDQELINRLLGLAA